MKDESAQKKKSSLILYIGGDEHLFTLIKPYFSNALGTGVACEMLEYSDKEEIQRLAIEIQRRHPKLIIVDISINSKEMLHLIRIAERMNFHPKTKVIGVTDATQSGKVVKEAIMAGVNSIHVKSGEIDGLCFNCVALAFPEKAKEHDFAKAKMTDMTQCHVPAKVCIVDDRGILVESNFKTTPNNYYFLESHFSKNENLMTSLMQCESTRTDNLYYNYHYAHKLLWPDFNSSKQGAHNDNENSEEDSEAGNEPSQEKFELQTESIKTWIANNLEISRPKKVKTLIVDSKLKLLDSTRLSDSFDYVIRCQPFLLKPQHLLEQIYPQIIFFEHELPGPDDDEEDILYLNNYDALKRLVSGIKAIENYNPFLIISNIDKTTEDLQKRLDVKRLIAYDDSISSDLIDTISTKLRNKVEHDTPKENEVVLDKLNIAGYSEFRIDIELITCSELDVYFTSMENFEYGTNLRVEFPVPMFISVAPDPKGSKEKGTYYGLINAIKAEDQMALRRYINSVFFREKEAAKAAEKEEIEAKKAQFLIDKEKALQEKLKKEKEEKERIEKDKIEKERKDDLAVQETKADKEDEQ